jgi:hypothetical protein
MCEAGALRAGGAGCFVGWDDGGLGTSWMGEEVVEGRDRTELRVGQLGKGLPT